MADSRLQQKTADLLSSLLQCDFIGLCSDHEEKKNLFCVNCRLEFCEQCKAHSKHQQLQIHRYPYYDMVFLKEIQNHFDCSEIQKYLIKRKNTVRLKSRPQGKDHKPAKKSEIDYPACADCGRTLKEWRCRFCSIECKANALGFIHAANAVSSPRLAAENDHAEPEDGQSGEMELPHCSEEKQTSEVRTEAMHATLSSMKASEEAETSERVNFRSPERKKKRKGIPCRALFF